MDDPDTKVLTFVSGHVMKLVLTICAKCTCWEEAKNMKLIEKGLGIDLVRRVEKV